MDVETVVGRRQFPPLAPVLGKVDQSLLMLDAHAHGEGFSFHGHAHIMEPLKAVPGRVADGEDELTARQGFCPAAVGHDRTAHRAVPGFDPVEPCFEAHFATEGDDLMADVLYHVDENIRADVGLGVISHRLRCAVGGKFLQDPEHAPVVGSGVQFAVGKSPGTALAELNIRLRVKRPAFAEGFHCLGTLEGLLAALEHDGPCPGSRQHQRRKHAGRPEAHHHGSGVRVHCRDFIGRRRVGCRVLSGIFQGSLLAAL